MAHKKSILNQQYEEYWDFTLEYTKFEGKLFNDCLKIIIDFMDKNKSIDSKKYKALQILVNNFNPKSDLGSVRKSINQFFKLGFINNNFNGYHYKTKEFLQANNKETKARILSEVMYDNASFSRSFSNQSNKNELKFLIKTMENCGRTITKNNLLALMYFTEIDKKKFLNKKELDALTKNIINSGALNRKYNQQNYLWSYCANVLTGIFYDKQHETLTLDEPEFEYTEKRATRDPYKQILYKYSLYEESKELFDDVLCYVEFFKFPVLIASHIKPYRACSKKEEFDKNNGLLLSRTLDQLFDQGWISFGDDGAIIVNDNLTSNLKDFLYTKRLDKRLLNKYRLAYLKYHRENIFDKNKTYKF